jgi:formyltetrahydrofolate hydrolase
MNESAVLLLHSADRKGVGSDHREFSVFARRQYSARRPAAFVGAKPYHAAYERGVKLTGATSHYVTEILDEGPIIECAHPHRDRLKDLISKGRDLEKLVLSRSVRWHLEHRILCYGNKTVVFA